MSWRISIWKSGLNSNLVFKSFIYTARYLTFGVHWYTLVFIFRSVSQKVFVHDDITVMSWAEYSSYENTWRLWSTVIQFLFNFQLIISVLNIITLLRSLSSHLLPAFITVKSVKRSSIRFRVKMIYSTDKFFRIQFILKLLLLEICLKCTVCNVLKALIMKCSVFGMWCGTVWHICARTHDLHRLLTSSLICFS
jgi:hypothetical protein